MGDVVTGQHREVIGRQELFIANLDRIAPALRQLGEERIQPAYKLSDARAVAFGQRAELKHYRADMVPMRFQYASERIIKQRGVQEGIV